MRVPTKSIVAFATAAFLAASSPLAADEGQKPVELQVGDKAPSFLEHDDQGKIWNSEEYVGKKIVVLFFFPAAMTGG